MSDGTPTVQFRAGRLLPAISERARPDWSLGAVADRDLERYYQVLQDELAPIALRLSEAEASLIVDALSGSLLEPHSYRLLWAEIADAIEGDGLAEKWGLSRDEADRLVTLLRSLSPGATLALVDGAERFWRATGRGDNRPTGDLLREVGLVRDARQT